MNFQIIKYIYEDSKLYSKYTYYNKLYNNKQ